MRAKTKTRPDVSPYDRLVDLCHELATEKYGRGAAISVDREGSGFVTRVWDPKGKLALMGPENRPNKADAFRQLKKVLNAE